VTFGEAGDRMEVHDERGKATGPSYLFVANQTLGGSALMSVVAERAKMEEASIHIVVPATAPADEYPPTFGTAIGNARRRLSEALDRLRAVGLPATGEVGPADPMDAIGRALLGHHYTALVISTLPAGVSRWLHLDLPHRAARQFNLPVEWIESRTDAPDEPTFCQVELPKTARVNDVTS
jgi:GABA permease